MSIEENRALARRFFEEADRKEFDPAVAREMFASTFVSHISGSPEPLTAEQFIGFVKAFAAAFPDYTHTIEDELVEGDKVVHRITWRGTHTGSFQGIAPTGKRVAMPNGINIVRIADGKIVEHWAQFDVLGLLQQLGAIPGSKAA